MRNQFRPTQAQRDFDRQLNSAYGALPPAIVTAYDPPPIPQRCCDWSAVSDEYEPGDPIGRGETEQEAIDDLLEQLSDE